MAEKDRVQTLWRNPRAFQNTKSFPGMFWVRINRANDDAFDAGGDDGVRAGRRAALGATRFERYVKRRAAG